MLIPFFRKSVHIFFLLVAFHFLAIQISYSSEKSLDDVSVLQKLAGDLQTKGYFGKAIPVIKEALALRRETLGCSNAEVARSLDLLGELSCLWANLEYDM